MQYVINLYRDIHPIPWNGQQHLQLLPFYINTEIVDATPISRQQNRVKRETLNFAFLFGADTFSLILMQTKRIDATFATRGGEKRILQDQKIIKVQLGLSF